MDETGTTWVEVVGAFGTIAAVGVGLVVAAVTFWRRPKLSLHEARDHWRVEASGNRQPLPYIRLLARNAGLRRASHGTRVLVEHYECGGQRTYLGSPPLGWTSAADQGDDFSVVIFPAGERSVDLGLFDSHISEDGVDQWCFTIAPYLQIHEGRGRLLAAKNGYIIRVVIGSSDGRAHRYDVHINWNPEKRLIDNEWNSRELLDSAQMELVDA